MRFSKVYAVAFVFLSLLAVAIAPAHAVTVYVTGNSNQFGSFDLATRVYTQISTSLGGQTSGLAYHNGELYGILDNSVLRTISTTGVVTPKNVGATASRSDGLASNGTTLYNFTFTNKRLQTVDPSTGVRTNLTGSGPNTNEIGGRMAFNGGTLYGALPVAGGSGSGLYSFNTTGAPTFVGNGGATGTYDNMFATFSDAGTLYGLSLTTLFSINTTNGALSNIGTVTGSDLPGFFLGAGIVTAVPESSLLGALGFCLFCLSAIWTRLHSTAKP